MSVWRSAAAAAIAVLVMPPEAVEQPQTPATTTPHVACPVARSAVAPPARPSAPPVDPRDRAVGGPALATTGLAIPPRAPTPPRVTATSWLVADLASGAVLGGCGPHEYRTPASVQKLLLAATMLPRLDPAQVVEVTRSDLNFEPGSSAVGLVLGGRYTVKSLWLGLLLKSGNDTANVLARLGGGTAGMRGGVEAMNAEARRLGAYQTHAVTPSGLDGPGQFTSAYDLALIARACFARGDFRRYAATRVAEIPTQPGNPGMQISNDNGLLGRYPGMLGGKTGFTDLARQTYVGVAERNGRRLAVTLLGAETQPLGSYGEATALLDWAFALSRDAAVGRLVPPDERSSTPSSAAAVVAPTGAAGPHAGGRMSGASSVAVTGVAIGAATLLVVLLVAAARRLAGTHPDGSPSRETSSSGTATGPGTPVS
ncbi:MAG TPA: D-alanyl-D-alanine carboxypeptidase [Micromonosporaceae bacterium]|nr:D-alanyl-D-alanine carboxypeptidase [Micromonosporaceae bacterium]